MLTLLAEEQLSGSLDISPRVVVSVSEVLTDDASARIETAWSKPVDLYASTEVGVVAVGSLDDVGLHVCEEAIVEVVDQDCAAVPPGVPGSKVLSPTWSTVQSHSSVTSSPTRWCSPRAPIRAVGPTTGSSGSTAAAMTC